MEHPFHRTLRKRGEESYATEECDHVTGHKFNCVHDTGRGWGLEFRKSRCTTSYFVQHCRLYYELSDVDLFTRGSYSKDNRAEERAKLMRLQFKLAIAMISGGILLSTGAGQTYAFEERNAASSMSDSFQQALSTSSVLQEINVSQLRNLQEGYVYIGRDSCPFCREFLPDLLEYTMKNPSVNVYYLNLDLPTNVYDPQLSETLNNLGTYGIPDLIQVTNGNLSNRFSPDPNLESVEQMFANFFNQN